MRPPIIFSWIFLCLTLTGCTSLYVLQPVSVVENTPVKDFKYAVINPTNPVTSSSAGVYGGNYGVYGSATSKGIVPGDVIKGNLIKHGMVILPSVEEDLRDETVIINYGESGRRNVGLGYTIEVTIQFISAENSSLVCSCTAEGIGDTEVDDVRIAINRCLEQLFIQQHH